MQPIGGRWNPRADFEQILTAAVPTLTPDDLAAAIAVGDASLHRAESTPAYDDYHRPVQRQCFLYPEAPGPSQLTGLPKRLRRGKAEP